jgi:tetratricopeptide (TPR) repeat protein
MVLQRLRCGWFLGFLVLGVLSPAFAQEEIAADPAPEEENSAEVLAGHSYHGEAFNDGPRQKAYLMEGTGRIDFPVTTKSEEAQRFINQGVGQLHGFWYFEAERSFRQAAALDPDCAMAYWGMAMANTNNAKRAKEFLAEAVERKAGVTAREAKYIDALDAWHKADDKKKKERAEAYVKALERLIYDHPEDIEAKAFLGLQLWQNRGSGIPITSHLAVEALLKDVLDVEPLHPCHHYLIHLWDHEKPERALDSSAKGGPAAPAIAHMWHMPGHIYSRLKRYHDAAWQQ